MIQPHLPVRLPCYDFTPVTNFTLIAAPQNILKMVKQTALGTANFRGVTGGVYKARNLVHRCMADQRLLAIPASCRQVAACNPNLGKV